MIEAETLLRRLERLEALREIEALKARYAALADAKYTSDYRRVPEGEWSRWARLQAACFTGEACWNGGPEFGGTIVGRDALTAWFRRSPWRFAFHTYSAPDFATGSADLLVGAPDVVEAMWRLWQVAIPVDGDGPVLLTARTEERYERENGKWLISRMRFTEIHCIDPSAAPAKLRCLLPREGSGVRDLGDPPQSDNALSG